MISNLNKSNATNYQLIFPMLPVEKFYEKSKEFTLNIYGTVIPSITLNVDEKNWQGAKRFTDTGEITFGEWNIDFVIDSEFRNWKVLYSWMMAIHNNEDDFGFVHEKGKTIDASLYIMNNYRNKALVLRFHDIWPSELGNVTFSKRDTDDDLICSAVFVYDKYEIVHDKLINNISA